MNSRTGPHKAVPPSSDPAPIPPDGPAQSGAEEQRIPIHGYKQIVEMLRIADSTFRQSLLRRIAVRDPALARALARDLADH